MSEYTHRGHQVVVLYDSLDHLLYASITRDEGRHRGFADGHSVDELTEAIDDMIDTMLIPDDDPQWQPADHEHEAIAAEDAPDAERLDLIREAITACADEFDQQSKTYMEHRGYRAEVSFDPERGIIVASCPELAPIEARSLQRLWHRFLIAVDERLNEQAGQLR